MLTLKDFFLSTASFRSKVNPTGNFVPTRAVPILGKSTNPNGNLENNLLGNALAMQAEFTPLTDNGIPVPGGGYKFKPEKYQTTIVFHGLSWGYQKTTEHPFGVEIFPGQNVWMSKPSFSKTSIAVNCQCKDYYFAAWYYNMQIGSQAGPDKVPDPRYGWDGKRKDGLPLGSAPGPNPGHIPTLCKHLLRFARFCADKGLILP
jgi:hypothetical protein